MLLHIPNVLSAEDVAACRQRLDAADWVDGAGTAGHLSRKVKANAQLHFRDPVAVGLGDFILGRLEQNPMFLSAALPDKILPPLFNRYGVGEYYGPHVDGAIRPIDGTKTRLRTDLSATLMLSREDEYDGGDLVIRDTSAAHVFRLPPGDMILYPSTYVHNVEPVTRGARVASFFWIQSMVRADQDRTVLFQLDAAIQQISNADPVPAVALGLTNIYHNLLRRWAEV